MALTWRTCPPRRLYANCYAQPRPLEGWCCPNLNVAPPSWRLIAGWKPALHPKSGQHPKIGSGSIRCCSGEFTSPFPGGGRAGADVCFLTSAICRRHVRRGSDGMTPALSLREIADPTQRGLRQPGRRETSQSPLCSALLGGGVFDVENLERARHTNPAFCPKHHV